MLTLAQKSEVYERVDHFVALGNEVLGTDLEGPYVKFDKRGTCGGTAWYAQMELNFNAGLMVDNWDEYMNQVIPHEVAHLLKEHIYGRGPGRNSAHGYYWKKVMQAIGVNPDRTHAMDVSKVAMPKAKHIYVCEGCGQEIVLSSVRHNKMLRGRANYSHNKCKGAKLVHKEALGKMTTAEAMDHKTPEFMTPKAAPAKAAPKGHTKTVTSYSGKKTEVHVPAKKAAAPKAGTKIATAVTAYQAAKELKSDITRQEMITVLADVMNCDRHAAAGYYQNCKKKVG